MFVGLSKCRLLVFSAAKRLKTSKPSQPQTQIICGLQKTSKYFLKITNTNNPTLLPAISNYQSPKGNKNLPLIAARLGPVIPTDLQALKQGLRLAAYDHRKIIKLLAAPAGKHRAPDDCRMLAPPRGRPLLCLLAGGFSLLRLESANQPFLFGGAIVLRDDEQIRKLLLLIRRE
jgi:hypothetical protein